MPRAYDRGVNYIIRRNLWFQCINTLLISLMICLYRHFVLSGRMETNPGGEADIFVDSAALPSTIVLTGSTSESVSLQIDNLLYVEAVGNYVKVYQWCDGQVRSDLLRATSKQIEDSLNAYPMIIRCHRAFLVNLGQVEKIVVQSGHMQLCIQHSHDLIPVSRSNMSHVKDTIKKVN